MISGRRAWFLLVTAGCFLGMAPLLGGAPEAPPAWLQVDYRELVDLRQPSHSGETVAQLWARLGGRPAAGARPEDAAAHALLEPLLEPMAFVLPDALDQFDPLPARPWIECGGLFPPGAPEPAWAELLRSRRFLVESDGEGSLRAFLPWPEGEKGADGSAGPAAEPREAARQAWEAARPVLRHVLAAEKARLKALGQGGRDLKVTTFPYLHFPARGLFWLGSQGFQAEVESTAPQGDRPPLDLAAWKAFFAQGLQLEGGRLEADGRLTLVGSPGVVPPRLLGQPLGLADAAVAFRAVFHGGRSEPYMSLDRGYSPQTLLVNYGGRLGNTRLGWVSLLSDIRFKTFSLGLDIATGEDARARVRASLPLFRTHLERFSADPASQEVLGQQTRLWFYPDAVEMVLSLRGNAMLLGGARMSAASERVGQGASLPAPAWTEATVTAINRDYDELKKLFPELADLDQVVRWLSLFTWLRQAGLEGLPIPDLEALLAVELPAAPTPCSFPQLLTFNALPAAGNTTPVEVVDQGIVGDILDRLEAPSGLPMPPERRFRRALAALNRRIPEQAELAREMEGLAAQAPPGTALDELAFRAERLRMHHLVVTTWRGPLRDSLKQRTAAGEKVRVFSIGIGGVDLGMGRAVAKAARRSRGLAWGGGEKFAAAEAAFAKPPPGQDAGPAPDPSWRQDPGGLPATVMPDHGFARFQPGPNSTQKTAAGEAESRGFPRGWVQRGRLAGAAATGWWQWVLGPEGGETTGRRIVVDGKGAFLRLERMDRGRLISFQWNRAGSRLTAELSGTGWPAEARVLLAGPAGRPAEEERVSTIPPGLGLAVFTAAESAGPEPATVRLRLNGPSGRTLEGPIPRGALQRMVVGRAFDPAPEKPLPGIEPLPEGLGEVSALMVVGPSRLPWIAEAPRRPGEEDPLVLARAWHAWAASASPGGVRGPAVILGIDPARSPARWSRASRSAGESVLLAPPEAFPAPQEDLRTRLSGAWEPGKFLDRLPEGPAPEVVILAGAENPGLFAHRLLQLSRDPRLKGRRLAGLSLGGPIRLDTAARILEEGNVAGLGLAEALPGRTSRLLGEVAALAAALKKETIPPEGWKGPLLWIY